MRQQSSALFIRADATPQMGVGHVMRTLALAQAWRRHGSVTYLSAQLPQWLAARILQSGCSIQEIKGSHPDHRDLDATVRFVSATVGAWVVIDGYHLDADYQRALKDAGCHVLLMDDGQFLESHNVDLLVNQNLGAETLIYTKCDQTSYLLGAQYILLRNEFLDRKPGVRSVGKPPLRLLITLGGSDPTNQSLKILQALSQLGSLNFKTMLVVGGSNPNRSALEAAAGQLAAVELVENTNMAQLMAKADLAVTAGGSTCWELVYMGVPCLVLVVADNQVHIAQALDKAGIACSMGWAEGVSTDMLIDALQHLAKSPHLRAHMVSRGQATVDGNGRDRVVAAMGSFEC